jgi:hypothetical protein
MIRRDNSFLLDQDFPKSGKPQSSTAVADRRILKAGSETRS